MDFNATINLIIKDLDEAREIIDDLKKYPGVPALQVELAKAKCKSAGEIIAFLKSYRDLEPLVATPSLTSTPSPAPAPTPAPAPASAATTPPVVVVPQVEITHPVPEIREESKELPEEVSETAIIADKFSQPSSLNEKIGGNKKDNDVTLSQKTKPITNLYEAIGVNDKFLFIREIFNGNKAAYTQAISQLDNARNLSDALGIILSYTNDNIENEAVKQLLNLVKLKLPSNE